MAAIASIVVPRRSPATPSPRRLFATAGFAALLGLGITLSFGYADHDPKPHDVRIAVAIAPAVGANVTGLLRHGESAGFEFVPVPDWAAAIRGVRSQSTAGALLVPASGAVTIVTAGAPGVLQQQAITAATAAVYRASCSASAS